MNRFTEFAQVWRGSVLESLHLGVAIVSNARGEVIAGWGDPDLVTYPRSALKPFQALALVERGAAEQFGLTPRLLALSCASHYGERMHTDAVTDWLAALGLSADDLVCGAQYPDHLPARDAMVAQGQGPSPVCHNCSGKHSGFLTLCRHCGDPVEHYDHPDHPAQIRFRETLDDLGAPRGMDWSTDGCTLPTPAMSMATAARLTARFSAALDREGTPRQSAMRTIIHAMGEYPEMASGSDHPMVEVARITKGRVVFKIGVEGNIMAFLPQDGLGIAMKTLDGQTRAYVPALLTILQTLGILGVDQMNALAALVYPDILDSKGKAIGQIRPGQDLSMLKTPG